MQNVPCRDCQGLFSNSFLLHEDRLAHFLLVRPSPPLPDPPPAHTLTHIHTRGGEEKSFATFLTLLVRPTPSDDRPHCLNDGGPHCLNDGGPRLRCLCGSASRCLPWPAIRISSTPSARPSPTLLASASRCAARFQVLVPRPRSPAFCSRPGSFPGSPWRRCVATDDDTVNCAEMRDAM